MIYTFNNIKKEKENVKLIIMRWISENQIEKEINELGLEESVILQEKYLHLRFMNSIRLQISLLPCLRMQWPPVIFIEAVKSGLQL